MDESVDHAPRGGGSPAIPAVGELPLAEALRSDNAVLDNALRSVADQLTKPGESYAAHGSAT
jgi:hypothetical protein